MKYIILQGDGMADYPLDVLGGKTPLEAANTPSMDWLAARGVFGLAHVIPKGFPPGSDVGNMSIMGYDPAVYHTGRSPLEAASMGVSLGPKDIAFRCNLVTLGGNGSNTFMEDFTSGHISTEEAAAIIHDIARELGENRIEFFPGVSYRHLMVWRDGKEQMTTTPPHDITDQKIASYMPSGDGAEVLRKLMEASQAILADHSVNKQRVSRRSPGRHFHLALGAGEGAGAAVFDGEVRHSRRSHFRSGHHPWAGRLRRPRTHLCAGYHGFLRHQL